MCLTLTNNSKRLTRNYRRRKKPIIAYKILDSNMKSSFRSFQWKLGLNTSDREDPKLTKIEISKSKVDYGFHLALEKPQKCPYQYLYPCPYRRQCPHLNRCPCPRPYSSNRVFKCEINPKDIVALGEWSGIQSIVAIKVTVLEEVEYE